MCARCRVLDTRPHICDQLKDDDDDDDNSDDDDVSDDNDDDNVADDDAGAKAMLDGVDCAVVPKMSTSLVAVSGMVGAVGGAKENAERNCGSG